MIKFSVCLVLQLQSYLSHPFNLCKLFKTVLFYAEAYFLNTEIKLQSVMNIHICAAGIIKETIMAKYKTMHYAIAMLMLVYIIPFTGIAQANVEGVINAEKSFAAYALQHNSRDAFMQFLDSANGIEFRNGEAKRSYDIWSVRKADSSRLIWQPAFAGIAKSGELGFTTGPWEYKKSANSPVIASGEYSTIWHLNDKGEWKYLVDIGTGFNTSAYAVSNIKTWSGTYSDIAADDPLTVDRKFIQQYAALHNDAYKNIIATDAWFIIDGSQPLQGAQSILAGLGTLPANVQFMETGGGISASGDLVYVYGTARHEDKLTNYMRVWQKTKDGYKILLQVM